MLVPNCPTTFRAKTKRKTTRKRKTTCIEEGNEKEKEKDNLHRGRYAFSVAEDFVQVLRSQDVPQGGLGK